jgi:hypothetical protein
MIVDTLGMIILVLIQGWRGGLRRIDKTCGMVVRPLMGGLSLVNTGVMDEMKTGGGTHPLDSKQT